MKKENISKIKIECLNCKKIFYVHPYRGQTAKYCSRKCLNTAKKGVTKIISREVGCVNCDKLFRVSIRNKDQTKRKYCSIKCYRDKRSSGYYQNHRKCIYCGKFYYRGRQKGKFCSQECFHKWSVGELIAWNKNLKGIHLSSKSEFKPGAKHIFWRGGISKEPYPFEFTKELKFYIKHLYLCKCRMCGTPRDLMVHHINYDKKNINLNNLIALCRTCHSKTNYNREYWIKYFSGKLIIKENVKPNDIVYSGLEKFLKN